MTVDERDSMVDSGAPRLGAVSIHAHAFLAGLTFLTRIPAPRWFRHDPELLALSTVHFPLIGAIVGCAGALVFALAAQGWNALLAAALSTMVTVWLTGAFHEDALADTCDGLGGGWAREQVLAIMKDSRVGSYGVVGLTLVLVAKIAALAAIAEQGGAGAVARALIAAHVLGRWSSLPLISRYPYVRGTDSRSGSFAGAVTPARLIIGSVFAAAITVVATTDRAVLTLFVATIVTLLAGRYFRRRIGGITGDCLGATNQVVELITYLVLAFQWSAGAAAWWPRG